MAPAQQTQEETPLAAFDLSLALADGSRASAFAALVHDLDLPAPTAREIAEAPPQAPLRRAYLARRGLARRVVARWLECDARDVEIGRDAHGAPTIEAPRSNLRLSLSGRDDLIAVAIADRPVGVDIEPVGRAFEAPLNVLHQNERAALAMLSGDAAHDHFMRLWTGKEAYLKALGTGLSREPSEIEIRLELAAGHAMPASRPDDVVVLDRGARVPLAAAFVQRLVYRDRPIALGCIVLDV